MEKHQREHIEKHLVELIKNTSCNVILVSRLVSDKILGSDDKQRLEELSPHKQSALLYDILPSRVNAYAKLILALEETDQTGALKILTENHNGFPNYGLISFDSQQELGRGIGTVVYKGHFDNRKVAVKVICSSSVEMKKAVEEITLLKKLDDHENIVRYFFAEVNENSIYVALELLLISLKDNITSRKVDLHPQEIIHKCTAGLLHLHSNSIIHGHLKPGNILVGLPNKVKISDFGLSKQIADGRTSVTVTGAVKGTDWVAPEILKATEGIGDLLSPPGSQRIKMTTSSDIFSLGCIFYFTLSNGSHPFGEGPSRQHNVLYNILHLNNSSISTNWIDVIKKMIDQNPKGRPSVLEIYTSKFSPSYESNEQNTSYRTSELSSAFEIIEPCILPSEPLNATSVDSPISTSSNLSSLSEFCGEPEEIWSHTQKLPEIHIEDLSIDDISPTIDSVTANGNDEYMSVISEVTVNGDYAEYNVKPLKAHRNIDYMHEIPTEVFYKSLVIKYEGNITTLEQIGIDMEEFESILISNSSSKDFLSITIQNNFNLTLVNNTVLKTPDFYIPRVLHADILKLNLEIFQCDCEDIFVFKNISSEQLTLLARGEPTSTSGVHYTDITSRFIHLENNSDWDNLRQISKQPIHLIRCENQKNGHRNSLSFHIEQMSGDSTIISKYIERMSGKDGVFIRDNDLISYLDKRMSVVICSNRGMGNSTLLANLAHKIKLKSPSQIALYFDLSDFIESRRFYIETDTFDFSSALELVIKEIATSTLSEALLFNAVLNDKITFTIFVEGCNRIGEHNISLIFKFLTALASFRNRINICISSTATYQNEICKILRVTVPYHILPFDLEQQVQCIESHLKDKIPSSISLDFNQFRTNLGLQLKELQTNEQTDIFGNPLMCNLLTECYLETFNDSEYVSIANPYEMQYIELLSTNLLFQIIKRYLSIHISEKHFENIEIEDNEKGIYVYLALKALLPEVADVYADSNSINNFQFGKNFSFCSSKEIKDFKHLIDNISFFHPVIPEYILAATIVEIIAKQNISRVDEMIVLRFLQKFISVEKQGSINLLRRGQNKNLDKQNKYDSLYVFKYNTLIYFINYHLGSNIGLIANSVFIKLFVDLVKAPQLYEIFVSLVRKGYTNLFILIRGLLQRKNYSLLEEFNDYLIEKISLHSSSNSPEYTDRRILLTCIAAKYANLKMVQECFNFFSDIFEHRLILSCENAPLSMKTPLHRAIINHDVEMVKYLSERVSLNDRAFIYFCIRNSYGRVNTNEREIIIKTCKILLEKNPDLVREKNSYYGISGVTDEYQGPLVSEKVDLKILKKLVDFGADIRATYNANKNIVQRAGQYMSETDFVELCRYLIDDLKAADLFQVNSRWNSPLHQILREGEDSDARMVIKCLKIPGINSHELDEDGSNFILCLVQGAQCKSTLVELCDYGIDPKACNYKGKNALHLAVVFKENKKYYLHIVQCLLSLGVSLTEKDNEGRTPLEQAEETLKEIYLASYFQNEIENLKNIIRFMELQN